MFCFKQVIIGTRWEGTAGSVEWCLLGECCNGAGEWVKEWATLWYHGGLFMFQKKKWEQMIKEQPGLAWHLTVSSGILPPLRSPPLPSLSLLDSHAALARYPRPRRPNEDVSLLLKTMAVTKMTVSAPSSHPPSHPLPPPQQMGRGESQTVFFKSSTSVLCVRVCVCVRACMAIWNGKVYLQNWHL